MSPKMLVLVVLFAMVGISSSTVDIDPTGSLNAVHDKLRDDMDAVHDGLRDSLLPDPSNGEMVGDKDPEKPSGGLFSALHLPGLPNLFSGLACIGSASLLSGQCDKPSDCAKRGRVQDGKGLCVDNQVCCVDTMKCGALSLLNNTIFTSPKYPSGTAQAGQCTMTVKKLGIHIRAVRVVLEDVQLSPPNAAGECSADGLWVEGVNPGSEVGRICGRVAGQHLYFPVGESTDDSIRVRVVLSPSDFKRRWLIRVVQVEMLSPSLPPPGCSQYFTGPSGVLTSFNADVANLTALGNLAGLKYTVCIRKEAGFCKLEFEPVVFAMGPATLRPSALARRNPHHLMAMPHRRPMHRPVFHPQPHMVPAKIAGASGFHPIVEPGISEAVLNRLLDEKFAAMMREYGMANPHAPAAPALVTPAPAPVPAPAAPVATYVPHVSAAAAAVAPVARPHPMPEIVESMYEHPAVEDPAALGIVAHSPTAKVCAGQDVMVFPPPDDETNSIHCGADFHGGRTLVTSTRPFAINVANKGLVHGAGFIIKYRHVIC